MTYEKPFDVDSYNDELRPTELCWDCLEYGEYLMKTGKIDTSDEDYDRYCDEHFEERYAEQEAEYEKEMFECIDD